MDTEPKVLEYEARLRTADRRPVPPWGAGKLAAVVLGVLAGIVAVYFLVAVLLTATGLVQFEGLSGSA